jgi:hypothetical protein
MNESSFSPHARQTIVILIVLFAIFVMTAGTFLIQSNLDGILERIVPKIEKDPTLEMTTILLPIFFFIMRGINFVAAVTLIVMAFPFWKGEDWPWPIILNCLSLPTIFGVLTNLPYIVQYSRPSAGISILILGLVVFLVVLLLKHGPRIEKWARFVTFTLLGMTAGHITVLTLHSLKNLITSPDRPYFIDIKTTVYAYEGPLNFISLVFCIVAIPLLADRKQAGWWLGLIAGITVTLANYPTHFIRLQTSDFFVGGSLGLGLTISLLIPAFRKSLLGDRAA